MWVELLNALCISLPIIAFASPATIFLPVFFPKLFHTTPKNTSDATTTIDHDVADNADIPHANATPTPPPLIEMPPLALTTQMLQCFLFAIYAHHFRMWTLFAPNSIGFALGFAWSSLYPIKLSPHASSLFLIPWRIQYVLSLVIMTAGGMTIRQYPYLSSSIAAVVGVLMCTYPLPSLHRAYRERNAKLLGSASMNAAMMTCCSAWVVHSSPWVEYDVFVLVSNAAGVVVQGGALVIRVCIARGRGGGEGRELTPLAPLL